jgi:small-conductance mechanosensitive channel
MGGGGGRGGDFVPDDVLSPMDLLKTDASFEKVKHAMKKTNGGARVDQVTTAKILFAKLSKVFSPLEVLSYSLIFRYHTFLLRKMHQVSLSLTNLLKINKHHKTQDQEERKHFIRGQAMHPDDYEASLFGHMENPVRYGMISIGLLYLMDAALIIYHFMGFKYRKDLPRVVFKVMMYVVTGSFLTKLKDYALSVTRLSASLDKHLSTKRRKRDPVREAVIDELTSTLVWATVTMFMVEQLSLEFGFPLKSVFAVGGIGSATIILALRSTFENLAGGLLLKIQDRFRRGEKIAIGKGTDGWVEEIGLVNTIIRRVDNTRVAVPNNDFVTGEVVNWSRTPFRIFQTHIYIPFEDAEAMEPIVRHVRDSIATVDGLASSLDRPLVVAASQFQQNSWHDKETYFDMSIQVDITCHMVTQSITRLAEVKTDIMHAIALGIKKGLASVGKTEFTNVRIEAPFTPDSSSSSSSSTA